MTFRLKRGGENAPLEVQRWQYFLLRQNISQVGSIDGQFGAKTEDSTKIFQLQNGLPITGELDDGTLTVAATRRYTIRSDNYYDDKKTAAYPSVPKNITSPSNADRNNALGCFIFRQLPLASRSDKDEIVPKGSCDGSVSDWRKANILDIEIPQLRFAVGYRGYFTCHKVAAPYIKALFEEWERLDLLHLIRTFDGSYNPRYKRKQSPGPQGHGDKRSNQVDELSNHAFASAFDVNASDNPYGHIPALCPERGCTRELVDAANNSGFFWGGHFKSIKSKDGMHFEYAAL